MPTIKDIARAAGVSHGTVSNVLNKRGGVSYEKIRLVEQTARAMGYAIDEKASLLRRGTTRILAVILPTLGEKHYVDLYTGILACADEKRYSVRLFLTGDMPYRERHVIEEALALKACGVLSVSCLQNHKKEYQAFAARKIPLLFLERPSNHAAFPTYSFHMSEAAEQIAAYVKARNTCARICVLTDSSQFGNQQEFLSVLRNRLDVADGNVYENVRGEQSVAAHEALLHNCEHACIAICTSEALADRLRNIFANAGKPVPEIYTLVSLQPCRDIFYYTVGLNYQLMGRDAAEAILTQAESGTPAESRRYRVSSCFAPPPAPALPQRRPLRMLAHDTPSTTALRYLLPRFTSRFGVPVELHVGSMEEILNILLSPQAVDWDVVRVDPSNLTHLAPRLFLPLNRVDSSVASQFNRFLPGLQSEFYNVGGEIYALPFDVAVQLLFYQKSLFEDIGQIRAFFEQTGKSLEVPDNYRDFDRICRFFSRGHREDSPIRYGSSLAPLRPTSIATDYLPRLLAANGLSYSPSGCLDLCTEIAEQTLREYIDYAACASARPVRNWSQIAQNFVNGQSAMAVLFANHASNFVRTHSPNIGIEIGFASIPGHHPLLGGGSLCIGRQSAMQETAYAFISWATGEEIAAELVMLGGVSACRCVYEQQTILHTYPWLAQLPKDIQHGIRQPILSPMKLNFSQRKFENVLGEHLIAALRGLEQPKQALELAQQQLDALLQG